MSGHNRVTAYLGLGGNIGDPRRTMGQALAALHAHPDIAVEAVSSLYSTPPWGKTDQPAFLNAAARISTTLDPHALLHAGLAVERHLKRERTERWGPRPIDIDVLLYGEGETYADQDLAVPHPRIGERAFVLVPLLELWPGAAIDGAPLRERLDELDASDIVKVAPADWWREG